MANTDKSPLSRATVLKLTALSLVVTAGLYAVDQATKQPAPKRTKAREVAATKENWSAAVDANASSLFAEGKQIFRFDTFGDEVFWTDTLKLHQAIEGEKFGRGRRSQSEDRAFCRTESR